MCCRRCTYPRAKSPPPGKKKKSSLPVLISLFWRPSFLLIFKISCLFPANAPEKTCEKTVFPFQQAPTVIMCTGSLFPSAWFLTSYKKTAHSHHSKVTETEVPWQRLKLDNNSKFSANVGLRRLRPSSLHRMLSTSKIHPTKRKVAKQTRHIQGFFSLLATTLHPLNSITKLLQMVRPIKCHPNPIILECKCLLTLSQPTSAPYRHTNPTQRRNVFDTKDVWPDAASLLCSRFVAVHRRWTSVVSAANRGETRTFSFRCTIY